MKLQLSFLNCAAKTQSLHRLSNICIFFIGITANSIVAISLTSHGAVAIKPPNKIETTVKNEQSIRTPQASSLGGTIKLDCSTRLKFLQPIDCPVGEGGEPIVYIPKEAIYPQSKKPVYLQLNQLNIFPESNESIVPLFEIKF